MLHHNTLYFMYFQEVHGQGLYKAGHILAALYIQISQHNVSGLTISEMQLNFSMGHRLQRNFFTGYPNISWGGWGIHISKLNMHSALTPCQRHLWQFLIKLHCHGLMSDSIIKAISWVPVNDCEWKFIPHSRSNQLTIIVTEHSVGKTGTQDHG